MLKNIAKAIIHKMGYLVIKNKLPSDIESDEEFISVLEKCKDYTMVAADRSYALFEAVKYVVGAAVPGDFVECGVWRGGQSMLVAHTLIKLNQFDRTLWLFDTFAGMSRPTEQDVYLVTGETAESLWEADKKDDHNNWCYASLEEVQKNVSTTNYPKDKINFVKGKVEDTIPKIMPEKISILRLDTDFYESTYHELTHLFPRLEKGGVLIIDGYGSWKGSKEAVDQYFKENGIQMLLFRVGNGRFGIKV